VIGGAALAFELGLVSAVWGVYLGSCAASDHHLLICEIILLHLLYRRLILVGEVYVSPLRARIGGKRAVRWYLIERTVVQSRSSPGIGP